MDILKLIKNRETIRKYKKKPILKKIIDKIIEAGRWSSSVHGFQPWKFIVISNKPTIKKISNILYRKSQKIGAGGNIILHSSADTISNAKIVIVVYSLSTVAKLVIRFKRFYVKFAKHAELSAISAAIQNMILTAESLGIGSCWLDTPLFCEEEINKLFNTKDKLTAILTLGYPAEEGRRAPRKPFSETVKYVM